MKNHLLSIINNTFEKEYFLDKGSAKTKETLLKQIEVFKADNPEALSILSLNLNANFPNAKIENFSQFFNEDRCIKFLVQIDEKLRFVCQISIYGYFSVYQRPYQLEDGKIIYEKKEFINRGESETCDLLFNCADVLSQPPVWLNKEILDETIFDFSVPAISHNYKISIADLLFTTHHI